MGSSEPTTCPDNTEHTVDTDTVSVVQEIPQEQVFDDDGNQFVVAQPRPGSEKYFYTHNLCDPCSWYQGSVEVSEFSLTNTDGGPDYKVWDTGDTHENWIDLQHGRIFKEDNLFDQDTYNVLVEVKTDGGSYWIPQDENSWGQTDNDFTFDYETGTVTFNDALGSGDLVRISGYKASSSIFTIAPEAGKRLKLEYVEVQYSQSLQMTASIEFEIRGYVDVFAPELTPDPYPSGTRVPLVAEAYKKIRDFYQESTGPYPVIPPHGGAFAVQEIVGLSNITAKRNLGWTVLGTRHDGTNWRAMMEKIEGERAASCPLITIPFRYLAYRDLRDSYGMDIRVRIDGNQALPGEFASVTFYCTTEYE
ncbi:MAG: hypothetical protein ACXABY_00345 [Candidatus Thorarchaeota archaeon]